MINSALNKLQDNDIYSLVLFALYKMVPIPEYSSLSELVYVLNKENVLKLCEYFGGQTIKIPTVDEFESLIYSLLLFNYIKLENKTYEEALDQLVEIGCKDLKTVKKQYIKLAEVIKNYEFTPNRTF